MNQVLSLQFCIEEHYALVHIGGELDIATAPAARDFLLDALAARHGRLVIDVAQVQFVDSTGAGVLISTSRSAACAGGWVRLVGPGPQMRRVLRMLQVTALLPAYDTASCAVADTPAVTAG